MPTTSLERLGMCVDGTGAGIGGGGVGRGRLLVMSRKVGAARDCTRSRARARTSSAPCAARRSAGCANADCSARMASSKVRPWACSICAATLFPSPTIAASTIAPLISRRLPPLAAAPAASRMRRRSGDTVRAPAAGGADCWTWARNPAASALSRSVFTRLASRTARASGSSHSAASRCSSMTSAMPVADAASDALASVAASTGDIGIWLKSVTAMFTRRVPPLAEAPMSAGIRQAGALSQVRCFVRCSSASLRPWADDPPREPG